MRYRRPRREGGSVCTKGPATELCRTWFTYTTISLTPAPSQRRQLTAYPARHLTPYPRRQRECGAIPSGNEVIATVPWLTCAYDAIQKPRQQSKTVTAVIDLRPLHSTQYTFNLAEATQLILTSTKVHPAKAVRSFAPPHGAKPLAMFRGLWCKLFGWGSSGLDAFSGVAIYATKRVSRPIMLWSLTNNSH